jgi:hypothetical protein
MKFTVIDNETGQAPNEMQIALTEAWAKNLIYCDMEGLVLLDECGNFRSCPPGRFTIEITEES